MPFLDVKISLVTEDSEIVFPLPRESLPNLAQIVPHVECNIVQVGATYPPLSPGNKTKLNSVASVRKRTIPTEQPPLVGEVTANFCVVSEADPHGR
jgi:hypothetical protein